MLWMSCSIITIGNYDSIAFGTEGRKKRVTATASISQFSAVLGMLSMQLRTHTNLSKGNSKFQSCIDSDNHVTSVSTFYILLGHYNIIFISEYHLYLIKTYSYSSNRSPRPPPQSFYLMSGRSARSIFSHAGRSAEVICHYFPQGLLRWSSFFSVLKTMRTWIIVRHVPRNAEQTASEPHTRHNTTRICPVLLEEKIEFCSPMSQILRDFTRFQKNAAKVRS